jgi:hypothetical protein
LTDLWSPIDHRIAFPDLLLLLGRFWTGLWWSFGGAGIGQFGQTSGQRWLIRRHFILFLKSRNLFQKTKIYIIID